MKDTSRTNVVNDWFLEGYFYSFSHTATSLSYSGTAQSCSAFPNTAKPVTAQHLPPAEPAHTSNARPLASQQKDTPVQDTKHEGSPRWIHSLLKPQTKGAAATCCSNRAKSREQKWVVACVQKTVNVSKPEAPHERNFSPCSSTFFQTEKQTCSYFQPLYQIEKNSFQNEVLGSSFAYLLSTPEHIHEGENHPAGLWVSGKIPEEIAKGRHSHAFYFFTRKGEVFACTEQQIIQFKYFL